MFTAFGSSGHPSQLIQTLITVKVYNSDVLNEFLRLSLFRVIVDRRFNSKSIALYKFCPRKLKLKRAFFHQVIKK
jgi:hypothetical protein